MPKKCRDCGEVKAVALFHRHKKLPKGRQPYCKVCDARRKLRSYYKAKYGITLEEADILRAKQDYKCGVCKEIKPLVVDHCHRTGRVRGMLCGPCNRALGLLYEDPDKIYGLINWLEVH